MMAQMEHDPRLAEQLIMDELFDLSLYKALDVATKGNLRGIFSELIPIERKHLAFWQDFFHRKVQRLNWARRVKLSLIVFFCRLFGEGAVHLVLQAIEVYGVRKYLSIWETYRDTPLAEAVRGVLEDEFGHEDTLVTEAKGRRIDPDGIKNIFLGFNDGLTELMGAVSGFFAAFQGITAVLIASFTVAVAGAFSMAAGAYVAASSAAEVLRTESGRQAFLSQSAEAGATARPFRTALVVGWCYLLGAMVPLLPVFFGARSVLLSVLIGALCMAAVSALLAFLSGMDVKKRIFMNLVIIAAAVGVTYAIGRLVKEIWGIAL